MILWRHKLLPPGLQNLENYAIITYSIMIINATRSI